MLVMMITPHHISSHLISSHLVYPFAPIHPLTLLSPRPPPSSPLLLSPSLSPPTAAMSSVAGSDVADLDSFFGDTKEEVDKLFEDETLPGMQYIHQIQHATALRMRAWHVQHDGVRTMHNSNHACASDAIANGAIG